MNDQEMNRARQIFAALITRANSDDLYDALWFNACGLGPLEDAWDEFQDAFEVLFGVTWEEAEQLSERFF